MTSMTSLIDQHAPALQSCGWVKDENGCFVLCGRGQTHSVLKPLGERDEWSQWEIQGPKLPTSTNQRVLNDNTALFGPVKLVARQGSTPFYRVDMQEVEMSAWGRFIPDDTGIALDAHLAWARAITTFALGDGETAAREVDSTSLVEEIKQCGWSASVDEEVVHIHLQLPGVFRQVRVESSTASGITLATDLTELGEFSNESLRAAARVANAANARLPLVRYAIDERSQLQVLRAEVNFGCALIPGAWLSTAIQVIEDAVALTARELEALRDPELAKLVLAATAA